MSLLLQSLQQRLPYELNSTIYLCVLCFVSVLFVYKLTRRRSKHYVPPSPPKLPFIGNLHQLGTLPHRSCQALSHKYGPLILLQLGQIPTLLVSSVDVATEIFKHHDAVFSNRPKVTAAEVFLYGCMDVGFAPYGDQWRQKRKICVLELLSTKRVQSFQPIREEEVTEIIDAIRDGCSCKKPSVNLSEMLIAASNNLMARCVLGQKYDTHDGSRSFGELGRKMLSQFAGFCVGDFFPSLGWVDVLTGQIPKFKATHSLLDGFFDQVIAEHKTKMKRRDDDQSDKKDFVELLLQLQERDRLDFELTQDNFKALLMDIFIGGSDTTSTTMEWTFAELMKNPNTMKKVREEVRRVVGHKSKVDENDVKQMNYLRCVVKETLRLHPPVPLLLPRETTSAVKLRGYDIPAKTRVFLNGWAIQRDPEYWDKPNEFIPDRFENTQVDFKGQDLEFIPFGTGRRGCPGISMAITFAEYLLANLLYWFDWKLPKTVKDIDMSERYGVTVTKKVPLHLEPIPYSFAIGSKP